MIGLTNWPAPGFTRRGAIAALIGLAAVAVPAFAADPSKPLPCQQSLWGCPAADSGPLDSGPPRSRYERLLSSTRSSLGPLRAGTNADFDSAARALTEATQLVPSAPEAHSLLGQLLLERGQAEAAAPSLHRAEELLLQSEGAAAAPLELADPGLALALALLLAQDGDLGGALDRYLRLLRATAPSHRLLYRTAEVLMALGRLDEATALLERACNLGRSSDTPAIDLARACRSWVVALDRAERLPSPMIYRRIHIYDREDRTLRFADYVPLADRDYQRALALPLGCERRSSLERYLQAVAPSSSRSPRVPLSYVRRAEAHLRALSRLGCPGGGGG